MKRVLLAVLALVLAGTLAACGGDEQPQTLPTVATQPTSVGNPTTPRTPTTERVSPTSEPTSDAGAPGSEPGSTPAAAGPTPTPRNLGDGRMVIETSKGRIVLQLYTDPSAQVGGTISNFAQKAESGHFDGLTFHRVEDWVIQGGDPVGDGTGGNRIPAEYNNLPFEEGSLGVARGQDLTANNDSQFFITKTESSHLNGRYTNWGKVIEGMDVVNSIAVGDKITGVTVEGVTALTASPTPQPQRVSVQHILIAFKDAVGFSGRQVPPKAAARTQEEARALAYDLLARAQAGEDFNAMVSQYTDDAAPGIYKMSNFGVEPEAQDEYPRDGMVPAFGNTGFALEVGEVTMADYDVQASPFGWHIVKRVK